MEKNKINGSNINNMFNSKKRQKRQNINYKLIERRKAMSPLLATVILIAFAVSIGALIINWTTTVKINSCSQAKIEFIKVKGKPSICYREGYIDFLIISKGSATLNGIVVRVTDEDLNTYEKRFNVKLKTGETLKEKIQYSKGKHARVDIYPILESFEKEEVCIDRGIFVEDLPACG